MKLIGLDFETANYNSGSICSVGLALLENGVVTDTRNWLVKPHCSMNWVNAGFTEIHGLTKYDLRDAPEFMALWPLMADFIGQGECVVIHNAPFDLRHLRAAMGLYRLPPIQFAYVCSLKISRKLYPHLPSHRLCDMAAHFGHAFKHHDALEDAIACAKLVVNMGIPEGMQDRFVFSDAD